MITELGSVLTGEQDHRVAVFLDTDADGLSYVGVQHAGGAFWLFGESAPALAGLLQVAHAKTQRDAALREVR